MSEFQLLVTPAQQTVVSPQLAAGSTIFNTSSQDAVWISGTPNPQPGNGYRVGGLGSIQWQNTGAAYAAVDTGVTNPVSLTVSDHVGNPVNPVDVATQTAKAVNAMGIPNVLLGKMVYGATYPNLGHSFDIPVDLSQYASVNIYLSVPTATNIRVQWADTPDGAVLSDIPYIVSDTTIGSPTISITSTVRAATLRIVSNNPFVANISNLVYVFATNRLATEGMVRYDNTYISTIASQAWAASQMVPFSNPANGYFSCKGGWATIRLTSSQPSTVFKGFFGYYFYDGVGALQNCFIATTGQSVTSPNGTPETLANVQLPPGVLGLFWQNSGTPNTYDVKLQITMGGV